MTPNPLLSVAYVISFASFCFSLSTPGLGSIRWVDCASNIPEPLNVDQLPKDLPLTLHCGQLDVPMDYEKPMTESNKITLGFSMYRPKNAKGLINFNPGGPSDEASSSAWTVALNLTGAPSFAGLDEFDFLAMDVRGSYSSAPLNCTVANWIIPVSYPENESDFKTYQASAATFAQSCIEQSTPKGILAYLGTPYTVQDWESVRKALGYEKIHILGWSYATLGAALYAQKYPQHVGRFVLDAILPPGTSNKDLVVFQIQAANRILLRADAYCINDTTCPFHSQGKGSILEAFKSVINLADSGNITNITTDDVRFVTTLASSGNPKLSSINLALYGALNDDWSGFIQPDLGPGFTEAIAVVLPTLCQDQHIEDNTFSGFQKLRAAIAKHDPLHIEYSQYLTTIALCGGWPYTPKAANKVSISTPMLLVTSDFDANTPTELANNEREQAYTSSLVVRHGDDHGTYFVQGPARSAEINFLTTGNLPKTVNSELVTIYEAGTRRHSISDPYAVPVGPSAGDDIPSAE